MRRREDVAKLETRRLSNLGAMRSTGMQLRFGGAFPLPCPVRINATIESPLDIYPTEEP